MVLGAIFAGGRRPARGPAAASTAPRGAASDDALPARAPVSSRRIGQARRSIDRTGSRHRPATFPGLSCSGMDRFGRPNPARPHGDRRRGCDASHTIPAVSRSGLGRLIPGVRSTRRPAIPTWPAARYRRGPVADHLPPTCRRRSQSPRHRAPDDFRRARLETDGSLQHAPRSRDRRSKPILALPGTG